MRCCILQQHSTFGKGLAPLPPTPFEFPSLPVAGAETGKMYILILHYTKNMYMCRLELMAVTIHASHWVSLVGRIHACAFSQHPCVSRGTTSIAIRSAPHHPH